MRVWGLLIAALILFLSGKYRLYRAVRRYWWRWATDVDAKHVVSDNRKMRRLLAHAVSLFADIHLSDSDYEVPGYSELSAAVQSIGPQRVGHRKGRDCDDAARRMVSGLRWEYPTWPVFYAVGRMRGKPHAFVLILRVGQWIAVEPQNATMYSDAEIFKPIEFIAG